jgi:hypothetical protein
VRLLAGIVRQAGGQLRVKGEQVDRVGESTFLIKEYDPATGEVVLRSGMFSFAEVFRVNPERQIPVAQLPPPQPVDPLVNREFLPKRNNVDDQARVADIERKQRVARAAAILREELRQRREAEANENGAE